MHANDRIIHLARQCDYEEPRLTQTLAPMLEASLAGRNPHGLRVLLKPNLLTAKNPLACTEPRFLLAVARWFRDQGADLAVGDSPGFGSAEGVLDALGALTPLRAMGIRVRNFRQRRPVTLAHGVQLGLATAALDCDLFVNLPRVKAHAQARVTMAVKNCFGCVSGFQKPLTHMVHGGEHGDKNSLFFELIASIPGVLPPAVHLVDGIVAMHVVGPIYGKAFPLGCVVCGANPVAVDTVLLQIVGLPPAQSPLWLAERKLGLPGTTLDGFTVNLVLLESLRATGFVIPEELMSVRFNPVRFIRNSLKRLFLRLAGK